MSLDTPLGPDWPGPDRRLTVLAVRQGGAARGTARQRRLGFLRRPAERGSGPAGAAARVGPASAGPDSALSRSARDGAGRRGQAAGRQPSHLAAGEERSDPAARTDHTGRLPSAGQGEHRPRLPATGPERHNAATATTVSSAAAIDDPMS